MYTIEMRRGITVTLIYTDSATTSALHANSKPQLHRPKTLRSAEHPSPRPESPLSKTAASRDWRRLRRRWEARPSGTHRRGSDPFPQANQRTTLRVEGTVSARGPEPPKARWVGRNPYVCMMCTTSPSRILSSLVPRLTRYHSPPRGKNALAPRRRLRSRIPKRLGGCLALAAASCVCRCVPKGGRAGLLTAGAKATRLDPNT